METIIHAVLPSQCILLEMLPPSRIFLCFRGFAKQEAEVSWKQHFFSESLLQACVGEEGRGADGRFSCKARAGVSERSRALTLRGCL